MDLVAFVPPSKARVPLLVPAVLMETRIFSIDCAVNAHPEKAPSNRVACVALKALAGKVASEVQLIHVFLKPV